MPHLNLNFQALIYEDVGEKNPNIRLPDLTKSIQGIAVQYDKSDRILINPGDVTNIAVTTRNVLWDGTTVLSFVRPVANDDRMRLTWASGTAPAFRTARAIGGDATTVVSVLRVTPYVARVQVQSGTAWTLSGVQVNDILRFEANTDAVTSPFSLTNAGQSFQVQSKGSDYIDFIDNGMASLDTNITLGANFAKVFRVLSQGPVKLGDTLEIAGANVNPSNAGRFTVTDVSSDYVEVINPFGTPQTVTYDATLAAFTVYEYLIGFVLARGTGAFKVRFGNQVEWARIDKIGDTALLLSSVSTFKIEASNDGPDPVEISIQHAKVIF